MQWFVLENPSIAHSTEISASYVDPSYAMKRSRYGSRKEEQAMSSSFWNNASTLPKNNKGKKKKKKK